MVTVVLSGIPRRVPLDELAIQLDKLLNTNEIGAFRVREIHNFNNKGARGVAIDFNNGYDAMEAQEILNKYTFTWSDGCDYTLKAKIDIHTKFGSRKLLNFNKKSEEKTTGMELVPTISDEDMFRANVKMDAQLKLLKKQTMIMQYERKLLREAQKLKKERSSFEKQDDNGRSTKIILYSTPTRSDDYHDKEEYESRYRKRSPSPRHREYHKYRQSPTSNHRQRYDHRQRNDHSRRDDHRDDYRRNSESSWKSDSYRYKSKDDYRRDTRSYKERSPYYRHVTIERSRSRTSDDSSSKKKSIYDRLGPKLIDNSAKKPETYIPRDDVLANVTKHLTNEIESLFHTISFEDSISVSQSDESIILNELKSIVSKRLLNLDVKELKFDEVLTKYRLSHSKEYDREIIGLLVKEILSVSNAIVKEETETVDNNQNSDECDNNDKFWCAVEEVLQDIPQLDDSLSESDSKELINKQEIKFDAIDSKDNVPNETKFELEDSKANIETQIRTEMIDANEVIDLENDIYIKEKRELEFLIPIQHIIMEMEEKINRIKYNKNVFIVILRRVLKRKIRGLIINCKVTTPAQVLKEFRNIQSIHDDEVFLNKLLERIKNREFDGDADSDLENAKSNIKSLPIPPVEEKEKNPILNTQVNKTLNELALSYVTTFIIQRQCTHLYSMAKDKDNVIDTIEHAKDKIKRRVVSIASEFKCQTLKDVLINYRSLFPEDSESFRHIALRGKTNVLKKKPRKKKKNTAKESEICII